LDADDLDAFGPIREICLRFDGAEEAELRARPLFRVGRRRFALFNGASSPPLPRWNGSDQSLHSGYAGRGRALREDTRFGASPHRGHRGWLVVRLDVGVIEWDEIADLLRSAYLQVAHRPRAL
jgi:hypothetical protein